METTHEQLTVAEMTTTLLSFAESLVSQIKCATIRGTVYWDGIDHTISRLRKSADIWRRFDSHRTAQIQERRK